MTRLFRQLATLALCAASAVVQATTLERLTVEQMIEKSSAIVRGRVTGHAGELRNGVIYTRYSVQVEESWKGSASGMVEVFVPGGVANGLRQTIPGAPALETGDECVVFLWAGASGRNQIIGLSQGLFNVVRDADGSVQLERPGAKEMMLDPQTGRPVKDATIRMPVGELKTRVVTKVSSDSAEQGK
ncbi:hypothetical protein F183_A38160 [Bryobacterales bacterium F-183]|nr:hypothetical protein F183_A38160 [Bryobacterales bacterium F-183]